MKKYVLIFFALVVTIGFQSCKKKIYGCMDETATNYSPVSTEDAQNCVFEADEVQVSNTVLNFNWSNQSTYWYSSFTWESITQEVINNGGVSVFLGDDGSWVQLPYSVYWTGYETNVSAVVSLGMVELYWEDSDGTLPDAPFLNDTRFIIFK